MLYSYAFFDPVIINVKAILDWKYHTNGNPMVDVGYFLMMFLQPSQYQGCGHLQDISLLIAVSFFSQTTLNYVCVLYILCHEASYTLSSGM